MKVPRTEEMQRPAFVIMLEFVAASLYPFLVPPSSFVQLLQKCSSGIRVSVECSRDTFIIAPGHSSDSINLNKNPVIVFN